MNLNFVLVKTDSSLFASLLPFIGAYYLISVSILRGQVPSIVEQIALL